MLKLSMWCGIGRQRRSSIMPSISCFDQSLFCSAASQCRQAQQDRYNQKHTGWQEHTRKILTSLSFFLSIWEIMDIFYFFLFLYLSCVFVNLVLGTSDLSFSLCWPALPSGPLQSSVFSPPLCLLTPLQSWNHHYPLISLSCFFPILLSSQLVQSIPPFFCLLSFFLSLISRRCV